MVASISDGTRCYPVSILEGEKGIRYGVVINVNMVEKYGLPKYIEVDAKSMSDAARQVPDALAQKVSTVNPMEYGTDDLVRDWFVVEPGKPPRVLTDKEFNELRKKHKKEHPDIDDVIKDMKKEGYLTHRGKRWGWGWGIMNPKSDATEEAMWLLENLGWPDMAKGDYKKELDERLRQGLITQEVYDIAMNTISSHGPRGYSIISEGVGKATGFDADPSDTKYVITVLPEKGKTAEDITVSVANHAYEQGWGGTPMVRHTKYGRKKAIVYTFLKNMNRVNPAEPKENPIELPMGHDFDFSEGGI